MEENVLEFESLLDDILTQTNLDDVTSEGSSNFDNIPTGYYLCQVEECGFHKSENSGKTSIKFKFKIVENGKCEDIKSESGDFNLVEIPNTKNRIIFKYYPIDISNVDKLKEDIQKKIVPDLLKFADENGPLFTKECFATTQMFREDLAIIQELKSWIWVRANTIENEDKSKSTFYYLTSWARASRLGLVEE